MDLTYIYESFQSMETVFEKVEFLESLKSKNLPYDINWDHLIDIWSKRLDK